MAVTRLAGVGLRRPPPLRMNYAARRGTFSARLRAEGHCLCFHALSRDDTHESRQAGQRQLTEGAEEAGTSASKYGLSSQVTRPYLEADVPASKYGLSSQVTRTARARGSWMFIPQKTSSGTHIQTSPIPTLPPARCRPSTHALTNHMHMRVLSPTYLHT